ncbi:HGL238Cp [Eremothecium sinecaudum]|uniref:HGL238Cp n=1 Tax=Eremothecium sinecaudum TaxID=45286 RepID=A0A0X8HV52_9SACH|nr:HGL238Cp [Eremothecium sinecaudum]AMD22102.1 HGL238Cp [Eremothecium sinecaudum]
MPSAVVSAAMVQSLWRPDISADSITGTFGNMMVDIQGDLEIQIEKLEYNDSNVGNLLILQDGVKCLKYGVLTYDMDTKDATLIVGKQRLLGKVVKLDEPLALFDFDESTEKVNLIDIITHKCLFKERPLPIM